MKKLPAILMSLFLMGVAGPSAAQVTPEALEARYAKAKSWQADFEQESLVEVLQQTLTRQGKITAARPDQIRIDYDSEPQKNYISDGKTLWIVQKATATAWRYRNPSQVLSREALSFLGGLQGLTELFDVLPDLKEPEGAPKIKDAKLSKIALIPKDEESPILRLTLGVNPKTLVLEEAVLFNASGNVTHYFFRNVSFDSFVAPGTFALPADADLKILDK